MHKFNNLDETDHFPENHELSKLNQDEIDNLNGSITIKSIKCIAKNLPQKKPPGQDSFTGKFYQTYKKYVQHTQSIPGHRRGRNCPN